MRAACCEATVLRNEVIAPDIRLLTVVWPDRDHAPHAGQFFTLRSWGADEAPFLSRPISVHRWNPDSSTIEFLYQVVGEGTEKLAQLKQQDAFQLTGPMGNGFDVPEIVSNYKKIAVVGGGIGTAPMFQLTRELAAAGVKPDVFFGFRDAPYCMEEYREANGLPVWKSAPAVTGNNRAIVPVLAPFGNCLPFRWHLLRFAVPLPYVQPDC